MLATTVWDVLEEVVLWVSHIPLIILIILVGLIVVTDLIAAVLRAWWRPTTNDDRSPRPRGPHRPDRKFRK
jgi:hypothetical protein